MMVIAGHNGAGKSTCYKEYLRDALTSTLDYHIDPDAIERQIRADWAGTPLSDKEFSLRAAKEATRLREQYVADGRAFSMETVLSDRNGDKIRFFQEAMRRGYFVAILGVGLDSPEKSKARVDLRVSRGGHHVDKDVIPIRYPRVIRNLKQAAGLASMVLIVDNSDENLEDCGGAYYPFAFFVGGALAESEEVIPEWWGDFFTLSD